MFFEHAKIEGRPYDALENEKKTQKSGVEIKHEHQKNNSTPEWWGKKYWWMMLIIGWIGGCWSNMVREKFNRKEKPETVINNANEKINKTDTSRPNDT